MSKKTKVLLAACLLAALLAGLYLLHPAAPLLLLASLLIQAPLVALVGRSSFKTSYRERAKARREQYKQDNDANAWMKGEEAETLSLGYRYWSKTGRILSALNCAEACHAAGQPQKAAEYLQSVSEKKLTTAQQKQYQQLAANLPAVQQPQEPETAPKS